jgi:hypothetical protein
LLRFNSSKRPARNYFSRREQWRLLLLVMSLGVVIIVTRHLRQPETAERFAQVFADQAAPFAVSGEQNREQAASAINPHRQPADTMVIASPTDNAPPSGASQISGDPRREALDVIRDNTYFRNAETPAWFELIARLQKATSDELVSSSLGEVTYVQLVDQPRAYRAKVVKVLGTARQVTEQIPAKNDLGLESYYRLVIQPSDGTQWPFFVYCLDLPEYFLKSENLAIDVAATGYFFKNLSYRWQGGVGIAPVILAKSVTFVVDGSNSSAAAAASHTPIATDSWAETEDDTPQPPPARSNVRDLLALAGWDAERFARFVDDQQVADEEQRELIELLWRVRSFDAANIERWSRNGPSIEETWNNPAAHKGELMRLNGHVVSLQRHGLPERDAARLELPAYFTCEIALSERPDRVRVITALVPKDWKASGTLNVPASVSAVFVKRIAIAEATTTGDASDEPSMLFVAKRIAWHPRTMDYPRVSLGKSMLGRLGVDVGLLDGVDPRGTIRAAEQEPFYQMLRAAGRIDSKQLIRAAQDSLDATRARWAQELSSSVDPARRALAQEVIRWADEARYSVAPLFNEPQQHIGELVVFDGIARRVVRVDVGTRPNGSGPSEVAHRFGFREYYEMEIFTDDSQNYPLVFCVRELPHGMPTGGALEVPVRVAGFFFKDWRYTTRGTRNDDTREIDANASRAQFAPLLIGRGPVVLQIEYAANQVTQWVLGGVFLLALAGIWATAWWFARGDRQFAARNKGVELSPPAGQFLKDLNVPDANEPMNYAGDASNTSNSQ